MSSKGIAAKLVGSAKDQMAAVNAIASGAAVAYRKGQTSVRATRWSLRRGANSRQVMTTPPTITVSPSTTMAGGRVLPATTYADSGNGTSFNTAISASDFSLFSAHNFKVLGNGVTSSRFIYPSCVSYNDGTNTMNFWGVEVDHTGSKIEFMVYGSSQGSSFGTKLLFKVDDEYVSLTPTQVGSSGAQYVALDFGGVIATRTIRMIGKMIFGGATIGVTDSIRPSPRRGPKTIVLGDSFTEGTGALSPGNGVAYPLGYVQALADVLGWNDISPSGIGGTGYLNVSGGPRTYRTRLATDVVPYDPELLIITGGINDFAYTQAQIYAEALLLYTQAKSSLPDATIVVVSPFLNNGVGAVSSALWNCYLAVKQAASDAGVLFVDLDRLPLPADASANPITLGISGVSAGTTSFQVTTALNSKPPVVGGTYATADGTREFTILTVGGNFSPWTVTVDGNATFLAQNTVLNRVGSAYLTGNGRQITFTGALSAATSGTLSSAWNGTTGPYSIRFSDGTIAAATLTNGSATVSWTGAVTATSTASAFTSPGSAEIMVGPDGTHPPAYGHQVLGEILARQLLYTMSTQGGLF